MVYVDHYSELFYVYLQQDNSGREIIKSKLAFKHYETKQGVMVQKYHASNGIFADKDFLADFKAQKQAIAYCKVNAHHKNGNAEKRIRQPTS